MSLAAQRRSPTAHLVLDNETFNSTSLFGETAMVTNQLQALDEISFGLAAGELDVALSALLQICKGTPERTDLETLTFGAIEFSRYPRNQDTVKMFIELLRRIGSDYEKPGTEWRLVFLADARQWIDPKDNVTIMNRIGSHQGEAPQGPHEESVYRLFEIAVTSWRILALSARTNSMITFFPYTPLVRGCAAMQFRDADRALEEFSNGVLNPQDTIRQIRESLGDQYASEWLSDDGISQVKEACLTGQGLALRDLGRFGDALEIWKSLRNPPSFLIAEVDRLKQRPAPSAAWRAKLRQAQATQSTPEQPVEPSTKPSTSDAKCFIATAACGSPDSWEVAVLRKFRDQILLSSTLGQCAVNSYYRLSPPLACWIERRPTIQRLVRRFVVNPLSQAAARRIARSDK